MRQPPPDDIVPLLWFTVLATLVMLIAFVIVGTLL